MYGAKRASGNGRTTLSRRAPFRGLGDDDTAALAALPLSSVSTPDESNLTLSAATGIPAVTSTNWYILGAILAGVVVFGLLPMGGRR